ncbi:MFS transporter [Haloplanus salilacus]|uniref:MFS transporter n=1 Tax=Haloplanus salilacus TaxID=2949994 RepID=UPI0030CED495
MYSDDEEVAVFTALAHATFHVYELSIPLFIPVWLDVFSASTATLGIVVGAGYALIGVGALPSGVLSDRFGSKTLVVVAVGGMGGGFLVLAAARGVAGLAAVLLLWGAAASIYHPAGLSLISRVAENRGAVFAYHGVGGSLGTVVGPAATAVLLAVVDWRLAAVGLAIPAAAVVVSGSLSGVEDARGSDGGVTDLPELVADTRALFTAGFALTLVVVMLYGTYYRGLLTFLPESLSGLAVFDAVVLAGWTVDPTQYVYAGLLAVGAVGQYAGGRLTDHVRPELALVGALGTLAVAAVAFVPASTVGPAPFLLVCGVLGLVLYAVAPIYQVAIAVRAPEDSHGLSYGYTYLGMFGVGALGAAMAGTVLTRAGTGALFSTLALLAALAAAVAVLLVRRRV